MENLQHDTHQFYFERYLRNKLSADERVQLEQRLQADAELRLAFESYKTNRKVFLKELINEHDKGPRKSRLANLFYLTITIIGILVALNFYLENKSLKAEHERNRNLISRLLEHIPFVGKEDKEASNKKSTSKNKTQVSTQHQTGEAPPNEPTPADSISIDEPNTLLLDTAYIPLKRSFYEEKKNYFLSEVDSTLTDAELQQMIFRNYHKYDIKYKTKPIGVQFFQNKELGKAYRFDGIRLELYGYQPPYQLLLINDQGELIWMLPEKEVLLSSDAQIHPY